MTVSTTGFIDALANHIASTSLGLTKGTDLFAQDVLDDPDVVTDAIVLFDRGYTPLVQFGHLHLRWDVDVWTTRKTRIASIDAVKSVQDALYGTVFQATSDALERFQVIRVAPSSPGAVLTEKLDSGRYLSESSLELQVIPG